MPEYALSRDKCVPCEGGVPPLDARQAEEYLKETPDWSQGDGRISRKFAFPDFAKALAFVDRVGAVAEDEGHHPDVRFGWGYAEITLTTHAIGGLSRNDFIVAAKIDALG